MAKYAFGHPVKLGHGAAREAIVAALAEEGFGILSEIDVAGTLKKKLGLDVPPYVILGACNPGFASKALAAEPQIGALLPCNVVVRDDDAGRTFVEFMDPHAVLGLVGRAEIEPIADEVRARLQRALAKLPAA
ncbi:MAG: DUF302 domain-containing protein [Betaproteobacteria bacterium]|jgi:uncharacterized protein (DUF302 family)|nr:DUF302 domain-containing protein [Betaproteobacteria bacterium]